jgi:hypothetical protein
MSWNLFDWSYSPAIITETIAPLANFLSGTRKDSDNFVLEGLMISLYDVLEASNGQLFGEPASQIFTDFSIDAHAPQVTPVRRA